MLQFIHGNPIETLADRPQLGPQTVKNRDFFATISGDAQLV